MTQQSRATLKGVFEQGDIPQGTDFEDLIDSALNLSDTTAQSITSPLTVTTITVTTEVSAQRVNTSALGITGNLSAASVITDAITVSGAVSASSMHTDSLNTQTIVASSSSVFHDRILIGAAGQRGAAICIQRATIAANTTAGAPADIVLPAGADILDFRIDVEQPFITAAGATAAAIRASVAGGATLFEMAVSASTVPYGLDRANVVSYGGGAMRNVQATVEAHVSIQGSPSAMTGGQAMLSIFYVVN